MNLQSDRSWPAPAAAVWSKSPLPKVGHPLQNLPQTPNPPQTQRTSQATSSGEFNNLQSILPSSSSPNAKSSSQAKPGHPSLPQINTTSPNKPILPNDDWTSSAIRRRKKNLGWIIGMVGLSGIAAIMIGTVAYQFLGTPSVPSVAQADEKKLAAAPLTDPTDPLHPDHVALDRPDDLPKNMASANDLPTTSDANSAPVSPSNSADTPSPDRPSTQVPATTNSDSPLNQGSQDTTLPRSTSDNTSTEDPTSTSPPTTIAPMSPFGDPLSADKANTPDLPETNSLIDQMGEMGAFILNPGIDLNAIPTGQGARQAPLGIGSTFIPKTKFREIDLEKRLSIELPTIQIPKTSLLHVTRFISELTGIAVQFDTRSVMSGRIDPNGLIEFEGTDITLKTLLQQVLAKANLTFQILPESQSILVVVDESSQFITISYPFPATAIPIETAQLEPYREAFKQMIQATIAPQSWNLVEQSATVAISGNELAISQTPATHVDIDRFFKLLAAAGRQQQTPDDAESQKLLAPLAQLDHRISEFESSFRYLQHHPILHVLNRVEKEDGVTILVDWAAISQEGWYANTAITWPSRDRIQQKMFDDTLADLLRSMKLTFHLIAPDIFEITTLNQATFNTRLEVYSLGPKIDKRVNSNQVMLILKNRLGSQLPKQAFTTVFYQPEYDAVVAVLPERLQLQLQAILRSLEND